MPLAYRQKPGWDYEPVTDDRGGFAALPSEPCQTCDGKGETCRDVWVVDGWSVSFSYCTDCKGTGHAPKLQPPT
jgi:DnaJ-class molecular chaperone